MVEDELLDAELVERTLKKEQIFYSCRRVETSEAFVRELNDFKPDLILSDYSLPRFTGMEALTLAKSLAPLIPFIIVTGTLNDETAAGCIKSGADDYVIKERIARLGPAVRAAMEMKRIREEKALADLKLRQSEEQFRLTLENVADMIEVLDLKGQHQYMSPSYREMTGLPETSQESGWFHRVHADDLQKTTSFFHELVHATIQESRVEYRIVLKDDQVRFVESQGSVIRDKAGRPFQIVIVSRDVTERKRAVNAYRDAVRAKFERISAVLSNTRDLLKTIQDPSQEQKAQSSWASVRENLDQLERLVNEVPRLLEA